MNSPLNTNKFLQKFFSENISTKNITESAYITVLMAASC